MEPFEPITLFERLVLVPLIVHIVSLPYYYLNIVRFDFRYYFWWQTGIHYGADILYPLFYIYMHTQERNYFIFIDHCVFYILMISILPYGIISYCIIFFIKPDRYLAALIMSSMEKQKYNDSNQQLNGSPPSNIYQLNFKYDNIYECHICMQEFYYLKYGEETILHCGHRYHSSCIRNWELIQFENDPYSNNYKCPSCTKEYNWRQKYKYIYTIKYNN